MRGDRLQRQLLERHGIEVPVIPWPAPPGRLLRIRPKSTNERADYQLLADRLGEMLNV